MLRLLRWLLGLCDHQWSDHNVINVYEDYGRDAPLPKLLYERRMRQRCDKCGKWRQVKY